MDDDGYADEQSRAVRRVGEGWSFVGPSSTLSLRGWREPSTVSSLTSATSSLSRTGSPTWQPPATSQPQPKPSGAVAQVLEDLDEEDHEPVLPVERMGGQAGLLVPKPLVTQPLVPHDPMAGQVLGLQQHPGSLPQPQQSAPGWRAPQLPGGPATGRAQTATQQKMARKAKGQFGALLVAGMAFAGPALFSLGLDAYREVVPPAVVEPAQPAEDGSLQVTRDFGTFTLPSGWSEIADQGDADSASFILDKDPNATLAVSHVERVDGSIEEECTRQLGSGTPSKLSTVPVIGGVAGVAHRVQDNGYTTTVQCAARGEGILVITGATLDTPLATVDKAMQRVASSLH
ncbi:MAG: hypothetical protein WAV52_02030 [Luteococcus japonicus]